MYALIKKQQLIGIFTSKKTMRNAIEEIIKESYKDIGVHGDYHFRYTQFKLDEISSELVSFFTIHPEEFEHEVETQWHTGEILRL